MPPPSGGATLCVVDSYLTAPLLRVRAVTIVYDLVVFHRDMSANREALPQDWAPLGTALLRPARLLCISQATANTLGQRFPAAAEKTAVAF